MLKKVLIGVGAVVVLFVAVVATRPADFRVERSAAVNAPADVVYAQVNDFHAWNNWSPWAKLDPAMKQSYEGTAVGVGSIYSWEGNKDVGKGRMTITDSKPGESVTIKLEFLAPMEMVNDTVFAFKGEGEKTNVTWTMSGHNGFMGKAFSMFMNMDQMVGGDFEKGLASLDKVAQDANAKRKAELAQAQPAAATAEAPAATPAAK